jgi:hypothetical protein
MINSFSDFLKECRNISNLNNFSSDWFGGVGFGYINNKLALKKLYFNFEKNIDINTFPYKRVKNLYEKFLPDLDSSRCAYNSIAIKKNILNNEHTNYFHVKLKSGFKFDFNDRILDIELSKFNSGVSVEYNKNNISVKRYYYITDKNSINTLLGLFKIKEGAEKIKYLEYTHNPKKIILIYNNKEDVFSGINNNVDSLIISNIEEVYEKYNSLPSLYGKYLLGDKTAIYWDLYKQNFKLIDIVL